jgi:mannose/fructose/N-acetylgalactosamine-specific phosphotransferase system component IIC
MMKKKNNKIIFIFSFVFFTIMTIAFKFTGSYSRLDAGAYYPPMSWEEYFDKLPQLLLGSLILGIVISFVYSNMRR